MTRLVADASTLMTCPPMTGASERFRVLRELGGAGQPERALYWLERAECRAREVDQRIDVAIARYQRGIRLLGSEGTLLVRSAEQLLHEVKAHPMLLHEDPARRSCVCEREQAALACAARAAEEAHCSTRSAMP